MIPHNRPLILPSDRAAVDAVLSSGWIAHGPAMRRLEERFVSYFAGGEVAHHDSAVDEHVGARHV